MGYLRMNFSQNSYVLGQNFTSILKYKHHLIGWTNQKDTDIKGKLQDSGSQECYLPAVASSFQTVKLKRKCKFIKIAPKSAKSQLES